MSHDKQHDWLSLIEISGPFLAVPVLEEVFSSGLEGLDSSKRKRVRQAYEEWRDALELDDEQFPELHAAWIDEVLSRCLELDEDSAGDVLKRADWCSSNLQASLLEHGVTLSPEFVVVDEQHGNKPLLLIQSYMQDVDLDATFKQGGWAATPAERMVQLCRSLGCRLGLVTNGERWMLVDAPVGAVTTFASWYARIWSQEPVTLQAFVHLLGIRRFFVDKTEQLPALLDRSLKFQDEVTDALGEQVRRAVEVLIQSFDKADQDRNRELLHEVTEPELYEAALTVMMRLVFLLSAEERGLLLMGDERYEANYALSTLRMQLRKESDEILERRWDAWSRLLATFRAVFGGIDHENLRLPALGGSLFNPDRFPFLEGRAKVSNWRYEAAKPLPIDNRTVLLLLEAIQQYQGRTLSYRALDVEQIGYVYEGLLERTVKRTEEVTLELDATKGAKKPWVKLAELDSARLDGAAHLAKLLQERCGSSASRVKNDLARTVDDTLADRLLTTCQGDTKLRDRIKPYANLLRTDPWGYPLVYPAGAFVVTSGSDRRESGTHYTPKSLTESIVAETLTPLVYIGPAEGLPRDQWILKSPSELLDLKICDPAMGSGAFLVQVCRWLSERLIEAWSQIEATGKTLSVDSEVLEAGSTKEPLPRDNDVRMLIARRLIAERCLYGVDLNPLAVELAKLSIWLVTLAKGRPFGFLDHNLRCGDSLLGIHRLDQLTELSMTPTGKGQQRLFSQNIERAVREAIELRLQLRELPIRDIRDVEAMARLDADVRRCLEVPGRIADAFIREVFATGGHGSTFDSAISSLAIQAGEAISGSKGAIKLIINCAEAAFSTKAEAYKSHLKPFHWPLEFPEVFSIKRGGMRLGFDAFVFNPPFRSGSRISSDTSKEYLSVLKNEFESGANTDLCCYFVDRISKLCQKPNGYIGFIATNSISQGDNRTSLLSPMIERGWSIAVATTNILWPGAANLYISWLVLTPHPVPTGCATLNGSRVASIDSFLSAKGVAESPFVLAENSGVSFKGVEFLGDGFKLSDNEGLELFEKYGHLGIIKRWLNGADLTEGPFLPSHYAIDFGDMPEEKACKFEECFSIVERLVKPIRAKDNRAARRDRWWQFGEKAVGMRDAIKNLDRVLVRPFTSDTYFFEFVCTDYLFTNALIVVARDDFASYSILNSSIHEVWSRYYGSALKTDFRYTPSKCYQTFPFPADVMGLDDIGRSHHSVRREIARRRNVGMTKIYHLTNDPHENAEDILQLRDLQVQIDLAVLKAFGWNDLLNAKNSTYHEFIKTNKGLRWSICDSAMDEIMSRLLQLNHQRYNLEQLNRDSIGYSKGLHPRANSSLSAISGDLFGGEDL